MQFYQYKLDARDIDSELSSVIDNGINDRFYWTNSWIY